MSDESYQNTNARAGKTVLECTDLYKSFSEGPLHVDVLRGVSLKVQTGETLAIVGESGSGKSTLLHMLGALEAPTSGKVELMGRDIHSLSLAGQGVWRNRYLGFVYQFHHLLPEFSALENVAMPLWIRHMNEKETAEKARSMLDAVGLAQRLEHRPSELSGGERQRVAIARALVNQPVCVMADEPTGNLDRATADNVFEMMLALAKNQGTAFIVVTHDERLANRCSRTLHLHNGVLQNRI